MSDDVGWRRERLEGFGVIRCSAADILQLLTVSGHPEGGRSAAERTEQQLTEGGQIDNAVFGHVGDRRVGIADMLTADAVSFTIGMQVFGTVYSLQGWLYACFVHRALFIGKS